MGNSDYFKSRSWNVICDVCGFKFKSDQLRKRWDGLMTCESDWEPRHPQDFLRARKDTSMTLPWSRPDADGPDVGPDYITLYVADGWVEEFQPAPPGTYFEEPYA